MQVDVIQQLLTQNYYVESIFIRTWGGYVLFGLSAARCTAVVGYVGVFGCAPSSSSVVLHDAKRRTAPHFEKHVTLYHAM